jgi:hypothetical protein
MRLSELKAGDPIHVAFKSDTMTVVNAPNGGKAIAIAHIEAEFIGWEQCPTLGKKVVRCAMKTGDGKRNEWTFPVTDVFIGMPGKVAVASPVILS